ncbi:MAG: M1 family metallopeptidase [Bacteroidia bacterium]
MKITNNLIKAVAIIMFFSACNVNKKPQSQKVQNTVNLNEIVVEAKQNNAPYQPASTQTTDLFHTKLNLSFNWKEQLVYGKATLTIKPYMFKKLNQVFFDANTFIIHRVGLISGKDTINLNYSYNSPVLQIFFNQTYTDKDTLNIYIHYTAQPEKIANKGGRAISDSKGLYFINHLGTDQNKPMQIWTQGETQFNSGWFPTIDRPNEKHTQEIAITVEDKFITLSNGELIFSNYNKDGTRTDYWKQTKPHAPYLTMIAVGEFAVIKDKWRNTMEVNYYVEPKYKPYAKLIFGNTPEMIEFFSNRTGVDYPWDKYSQVVVRDFVSGAMENTSAVVHYEGVAHTDREHEDYDSDDIIAHELFHHWFGDLVTCKSWSNLPLNESFATYGEYLWHEYKYGKNHADFEFTNNLEAYLRTKNKYNVTPIRHHYHNEVELFDVVSYQKGSRILHLLRNQIGDDAFFKGMQIYLTKNKFGTADIHHLRHAMEEASGTDLLLFFNQWFLQVGHPVINVNYTYANNKLQIIVKQKPTDSIATPYQIKTLVEYGYNKNDIIQTITKEVNLKNFIDTFIFDIQPDPLWFVFDAQAVMPAQIFENKPENFWLNQLIYATNHAIKKRVKKQFLNFKDSLNISNAINYCLTHNQHYINEMGYEMLFQHQNLIPIFLNIIEQHAISHKKSSCRAYALNAIAYLNDIKFKNLFEKSINDKSYNVVSTALFNLLMFDTIATLNYAITFENDENAAISLTLAELYTDLAVENKNSYFITNLGKHGLYRNMFIDKYIGYLLTQDLKTIETGIDALLNYKQTCSDKNISFYADKWANKLKQGIEKDLKENDSISEKLLQLMNKAD